MRLGQIVICNGFRNPALVAKMAATLDTISGGRFELGIGAGWKREEWLAYGYGFPETGERLAMLHDALEVISRMLEPGNQQRATYAGTHASVDGAINLPKPIQSSGMPIMVGGNGPKVTWRLAARYADELNLDGLSPDELREALPVIAARCEEIGRDPAELAVSLHAWWGEPAWSEPGSVPGRLPAPARRPGPLAGDRPAPGIGRCRRAARAAGRRRARGRAGARLRRSQDHWSISVR